MPAAVTRLAIAPVKGLRVAAADELDIGRELAAGDAVLRVTEPVPRCVVTTRHPDSGRRDAPTLKRLAELRGKRDVTFGVWCEVVAPGRVRVGDQVAIAT
jgi:uncharacterized protein YcbX